MMENFLEHLQNLRSEMGRDKFAGSGDEETRIKPVEPSKEISSQVRFLRHDRDPIVE